MNKGLVFGGDSAGAVVAGSTLHGIELLDDPKAAAEIVWDGLNLVNFGIIPHWGWPRYGELLEAAKVVMERYSRVVTLGNDEAMVIQGESLEIVTVAGSDK